MSHSENSCSDRPTLQSCSSTNPQEQRNHNPILFRTTKSIHSSRNLNQQQTVLQHQPGPHGVGTRQKSASSHPTYSSTRETLHINRIRSIPALSLVAMPKIAETHAPPSSSILPSILSILRLSRLRGDEKQPRRITKA
jgi:hypothetical protein